jgi:hypothetical protein
LVILINRGLILIGPLLVLIARLVLVGIVAVRRRHRRLLAL